MALFSKRTWSDWIDEYAQSHQHPANRFCHTIGIPMVTLSVGLAVAAAVLLPSLWIPAVALFAIGWTFQFVGHAYEGKPPELFKDLRFMLVGVRWWVDKTQGRV